MYVTYMHDYILVIPFYKFIFYVLYIYVYI